MSRRKHEDNYATIDHVIPKSLGWLILSVNLIDNKKLACRKCNQIKGSMPVEKAIKIIRSKNDD